MSKPCACNLAISKIEGMQPHFSNTSSTEKSQSKTTEYPLSFHQVLFVTLFFPFFPFDPPKHRIPFARFAGKHLIKKRLQLY